MTKQTLTAPRFTPVVFAALLAMAFAAVAQASIVISEVMYDPASPEDNWEWVELYNSGPAAVDLAGSVIDDNNGTAHGSANIAAGLIPVSGFAVLYNADDISASDFTAAWGAGINLVAVTHWSAMGLNNGGDTIGLWGSFADYSGDHAAHANTILSVAYPDLASSGPSVALTDLADQGSFAVSQSGVDGAYVSTLDAGNVGDDVGSPGVGPATAAIPEPSSLIAWALLVSTGAFGFVRTRG
ncbi:hypothetical protein Mal64_26590 [Pseudobythopirellula maris]|uniref:LTD domain-containing protein n=1 Tax=Pseudobythopirellula maris TaxID=2527991 RepID=A0A5C5ZID6_9BACT|nr:lamin tail domain-containing protein [Pseudobythopirellula maris]TWT87124.1 hypothetical protein Mal64_26590 [Pseudobythopirellula maris]